LALAGKGQPELCKAQIVTWHQPPVKKNKKRGTQKFRLLRKKPARFARKRTFLKEELK